MSRFKRTPIIPVVYYEMILTPVHNPDNVALDRLDSENGWRLLRQDEIHSRAHKIDLQKWTGSYWSITLCLDGSDAGSSYRTKLPYPIP